MPRFDLAALTKRQRNVRRSAIVIRDIAPPATLATDLFAAAYKPVVATWTAALPRILAAYERSIAEIRTDSAADVQGEINAAADAVARLLLILTPEVRDWALRVSRFVDTKWRGAVLAATSVDLATLLGPEGARQTIANYVEWNASLVKDVSQQAAQRISTAVFTGLNERKPAREVAAEIAKAADLARDRSLRIASHQMSSLAGELARERRREAGLEIFAWHHSRKRFPRQEHVERDGHLYTENPALVGKKVDGKEVRAAPPANDRAGVKPACGCRERGVLVFSFDGEE